MFPLDSAVLGGLRKLMKLCITKSLLKVLDIKRFLEELLLIQQERQGCRLDFCEFATVVAAALELLMLL